MARNLSPLPPQTIREALRAGDQPRRGVGRNQAREAEGGRGRTCGRKEWKTEFAWWRGDGGRTYGRKMWKMEFAQWRELSRCPEGS
ncbi:hypothetical protein E2562_012386 [Oryza meyeriana var. granulata]|uniref:Uncharacterized protein n=1 Tax=Oryza meyeriana var. granulata TaxID=110450 RepID=A0A6G1C705_9ORYZ|nr:hypothetical protein E2562_012386 [Oryza meyeriana var. granulata]